MTMTRETDIRTSHREGVEHAGADDVALVNCRGVAL